MKRARGFTAIELAICLSISAVLVPAAYVFLRALTARADLASWKLKVAGEVRTLSEQAQADSTRADCKASWTFDEQSGSVKRTASQPCGGDSVLVRGVTRFERTEDGLTLTFALRESPGLTHTLDVFLAGAIP